MAKYDSERKIKRNAALVKYWREHPQASLGEIGRVFNISRARVGQLVKQYGGKRG